jgi:hypothetical protein
LRNKIVHDLDLAWSRTVEFGFHPTDVQTEIIKWLALYHKHHEFRYRQPGYKQLPAIKDVVEMVRSLINDIGPQIDQNYRSWIKRNRDRLRRGAPPA